jgi:hypothetical protein
VELRESLRSRRAAIIDRWANLALTVYTEDYTRRLKQEKDRFQNPVGHMTRSSLEEVLDGLLAGRPAADLTGSLDGIVRIRAVQELSPSRALEFIFLLKRAVREALGDDAGTDLTDLDAAVDRLALAAFDLYTQCKEKIHELRRNEIRRNASGLLERRQRAAASKHGEPAGNRRKVKGGSEA